MSKGQAPRRRFSQNFLTDPSVAARIVDACSLSRAERVLEIGPGRGALTEPLLRQVDQLHAIELDRDLAAALRHRWPALLLQEADALRVDYATFLRDGTWTIVGNLPYNVSTPLLMRLLLHASALRQMVFMLQQEVVDRMCAPPGSKTYGRLSVMVGYHCRAQALFEVSAGSFYPVPKVRSRIIRLTPLHPPPMPLALPEVVRRAFTQRRKTLRNALSGCVDAQHMLAVGVDPGRRPETLSIDEYVRLAGVAFVERAQPACAATDENPMEELRGDRAC